MSLCDFLDESVFFNGQNLRGGSGINDRQFRRNDWQAVSGTGKSNFVSIPLAEPSLCTLYNIPSNTIGVMGTKEYSKTVTGNIKQNLCYPLCHSLANAPITDYESS